MCDFWYNANLNYKNYKKQLKTSAKFGCGIMIPVFITPKERDEYNKTETKTKSYIITEILKIFKKMPLLETVAEF